MDKWRIIKINEKKPPLPPSTLSPPPPPSTLPPPPPPSTLSPPPQQQQNYSLVKCGEKKVKKIFIFEWKCLSYSNKDFSSDKIKFYLKWHSDDIIINWLLLFFPFKFEFITVEYIFSCAKKNMKKKNPYRGTEESFCLKKKHKIRTNSLALF